MNSHMRVVVIDYAASSDSPLTELLEKYGSSVFVPAPGEPVLEAVLSKDPHVVVLRAASTPAAALETARTLKSDSETKHTPIILLGDDSAGALHMQALDAGVDSLMPSESHDIELYTRVRALARLKVMQSELVRRDTIERQFGLSRVPLAPAPIDTDSPAILAAGDLGAHRGTLASGIEGEPYVSFADDPRSAIDELVAGNFDAAVIGVDGAAAEWLTMCSDVRGNPRLFNLPIMLIADADCFPDPTVPYQNGATDLLLNPVDKDEFSARLQMLIRQQRYRRQLQEAYRRSRYVETGDSLTGLYSFGYLHDYLASQIADAERLQKVVSVGLFDVAGMAAINAKHGYAGGDKLLRQAGGLIGRLVRSEDLTARYSGQEFCVVMPDTPGDQAATALRRIADIVGQTEFGTHNAADPVALRLSLGATTIEPGDSAESLIARARASRS